MKSVLSFINNNHEAIIALFALIVSCVAIYQTNSALRIQRKHNYLSVRPMPSVLRQNFEDRVGVVLENRGLGPMLITELSVLRGDERVGTNLVDSMPTLKGNRIWSNFWRGLQGTVLQPERKIELLLLTGDMSDPTYVDNRDAVRAALSELTVELVYSDVYGHSFVTKEALSAFKKR